MIGKLPFHIAPGATETPWDYASRLAVCNLRENAMAFCADFGIAHPGLANGDESAIRELAALADVDPRSLVEHAYRRVSDERAFRYRGETLARSQMNRGHVKACPICIEEDLENVDAPLEARPHRRAHWILGTVRTCHRHGVALVDLRSPAPPASWYDTSVALSQMLPALSKLTSACLNRSPTRLERYVTDRLFGPKGSAWIDALALHVVIDIAPIVGLVAVEGPLRGRALLREGDPTTYENVGTEIMLGGESTFRAFLDRVTMEAFHEHPTAWGPRKLLGALYERLSTEAGHPDYQPIRNIIFLHLNDTLPVGPEDVAFGKPFPSRKVHSVRSAALELDVNPCRLGGILQRGGFIKLGTGSPDRLLFDAQAAAPLLHSIGDALTLNGFEDYLGIPRLNGDAIVSMGLVKVLDEFLDTRGKRRITITKTDADKFMDELRMKADPTLTTHGMFNMLAASRLCVKSASWILKMVMSDELSRVALDPSKTGYLSILVDPAEIRRITDDRDKNILTLQEVEKILRTTRKTINKLISRGHLNAIRAVSRSNKRPQFMVHKDEIDRFSNEFVSLHVLCAERGVDFRTLLTELRTSGVCPVCDRKEIGITMFRRSDLD